jgi:hypothetical protein
VTGNLGIAPPKPSPTERIDVDPLRSVELGHHKHITLAHTPERLLIAPARGKTAETCSLKIFSQAAALSCFCCASTSVSPF